MWASFTCTVIRRLCLLFILSSSTINRSCQSVNCQSSGCGQLRSTVHCLESFGYNRNNVLKCTAIGIVRSSAASCSILFPCNATQIGVAFSLTVGIVTLGQRGTSGCHSDRFSQYGMYLIGAFSHKECFLGSQFSPKLLKICITTSRTITALLQICIDAKCLY